MKRKLLAALLIGSVTIAPMIGTSVVRAASKDTAVETQMDRPPLEQDQIDRAERDGQPPEPPKDENGDPLPPPDMKDRDAQSDEQSDGRKDRKHPPRDQIDRADDQSDDQSDGRKDRKHPPRHQIDRADDQSDDQSDEQSPRRHVDIQTILEHQK